MLRERRIPKPGADSMALSINGLLVIQSVLQNQEAQEFNSRRESS